MSPLLFLPKSSKLFCLQTQRNQPNDSNQEYPQTRLPRNSSLERPRSTFLPPFSFLFTAETVHYSHGFPDAGHGWL
jgi:hypothetical protein